jgi:hypothetical protein
MMETPCIRHDRVGTDNPLLREILADAGTRTAADLNPFVRALYDYDGHLLATWRNTDARERYAGALTAAWRARMGGSSILHLVPSDDDYDYQEDVVDNGADA